VGRPVGRVPGARAPFVLRLRAALRASALRSSGVSLLSPLFARLALLWFFGRGGWLRREFHRHRGRQPRFQRLGLVRAPLRAPLGRFGCCFSRSRCHWGRVLLPGGRPRRGGSIGFISALQGGGDVTSIWAVERGRDAGDQLAQEDALLGFRKELRCDDGFGIAEGRDGVELRLNMGSCACPKNVGKLQRDRPWLEWNVVRRGLLARTAAWTDLCAAFELGVRLVGFAGSGHALDVLAEVVDFLGRKPSLRSFGSKVLVKVAHGALDRLFLVADMVEAIAGGVDNLAGVRTIRGG
jgi:hypothetical protein